MFVERPGIKDLTESRPPRDVEVMASSANELLISLWTMATEEDQDSFALGSEWFQNLENGMSTRLSEELAEWKTTHGTLWTVLIGLSHRLPAPRDVEALLRWLDSVDGSVVRRALTQLKCHDLDEQTVESAALGDPAAVNAILAELTEHPGWRAELGVLMEIPVNQIGPRLAATIRQFQTEVFAKQEKQFIDPTGRDAEARAALARTMPVEQLIEIVTNGVKHQLPAHVRRLVLVPSVVLRPWSLLVEDEDTYVLCYPVADEFLDSDPDAPPQWLVNTYKALGDERRLRIMRRLAEGPASLLDLSELLDLNKSTIHHHIGLLRSAGLVSVEIGPGKQAAYGIRTETVPEAARLLHTYLGSSAAPGNAPPISSENT